MTNYKIDNMGTLVEVARKRHESTAHEVMSRLELTPLEYYNSVFEHGILFLTHVFNSETDEYRLLSTDKLFWKWFRTEWHFAEKRWVEISRSFINSPKIIARVMFNEHMHHKCILSKSIHDSFHTWIKYQNKR